MDSLIYILIFSTGICYGQTFEIILLCFFGSYGQINRDLVLLIIIQLSNCIPILTLYLFQQTKKQYIIVILNTLNGVFATVAFCGYCILVMSLSKYLLNNLWMRYFKFHTLVIFITMCILTVSEIIIPFNKKWDFTYHLTAALFESLNYAFEIIFHMYFLINFGKYLVNNPEVRVLYWKYVSIAVLTAAIDTLSLVLIFSSFPYAGYSLIHVSICIKSKIEYVCLGRIRQCIFHTIQSSNV